MNEKYIDEEERELPDLPRRQERFKKRGMRSANERTVQTRNISGERKTSEWRASKVKLG